MLHCLDKTTAFHQVISNQRKTNFKESANHLTVFFNFADKLNQIINSPELKKQGYFLTLGSSFDKIAFIKRNFSNGLSFGLYKNNELMGDFNFDLIFNKENKPSIILGNFQAAQDQLVKEFKEKMNKSVLSHFIDSFKKVFPKKQLLALNPKYHSYRDKKTMPFFTVGISMYSRGELTKKELNLLESYSLSNPPKKHVKTWNELIEKINKKREQIKRFASGMHYSAYSKAGFHFTDSMKKRKRYFRPK